MTTIGLIGCGLWGRTILRELLTLGVSVKVFDSQITNYELRITNEELTTPHSSLLTARAAPVNPYAIA